MKKEKTLDDYEDKIEEWHTIYKGDLQLHEFLGLSWEEYTELVSPKK